MDDKTAERIFCVIDGIKVSVNNVEKLFVAQNETIKGLADQTKEFIAKVDTNVFHPNAGCMVRHKSTLGVHKNQLVLQWALIFLLLTGLLGLLWTNLPKMK